MPELGTTYAHGGYGGPRPGGGHSHATKKCVKCTGLLDLGRILEKILSQFIISVSVLFDDKIRNYIEFCILDAGKVSILEALLKVCNITSDHIFDKTTLKSAITEFQNQSK